MDPLITEKLTLYLSTFCWATTYNWNDKELEQTFI